MKLMGKWRILLLVALLALGGLAILAACSSGDDDDDNDTTAADDDNDASPVDDDDDNDDASPADDDDDDNDDNDDTTPTGDPWVDGGFNEESWEPCAGALCQQYVYASVHDVFSISQASDAMTGTMHQLLGWQLAGDTVAGDYDLTIETGDKAETLTTFVLLYVNAKQQGLTMVYDALYISTGGTMHVTEIGKTNGAAFTANLEDVEFTEASINGSYVTINPEGKTGFIGSVDASGSILVMPL